MNVRLGQAKSAIKKMKSILCNKNLTFKSRFHVLNCYIYPIFTYCPETWNISKAMESRIQAFEMWCLGVCNEFYGEQESQMKMSSGKLAIIQGC